MAENRPQSVEELMSIKEVESIGLPDGDVGEGLQFQTNRGSFKAILHRAPDADQAVSWVCGARAGFGRRQAVAAHLADPHAARPKHIQGRGQVGGSAGVGGGEGHVVPEKDVVYRDRKGHARLGGREE